MQKRHGAFTLVELMVVTAVVGVVAAVAGAGIADMLRAGRVRNENAAVTSALASLRSNAIRTGQAGAVSVSDSGKQVNFAVIRPGDCAAFQGSPGVARDLNTLELTATTVQITQGSASVGVACFLAQGFVPTAVSGEVVSTTLSMVDVESSAPVASPTIAEIGTISVPGEPLREGASASGLRAVAFVDAAAPAAVEPTPTPAPIVEPTAPRQPPPRSP